MLLRQIGGRRLTSAHTTTVTLPRGVTVVRRPGGRRRPADRVGAGGSTCGPGGATCTPRATARALRPDACGHPTRHRPADTQRHARAVGRRPRRTPGPARVREHLLHEVWGPRYDTETGMGYRFEPGEAIRPVHRSAVPRSAWEGAWVLPVQGTRHPAIPPRVATAAASGSSENSSRDPRRRALTGMPTAGRGVTLS
jgi:hypothetical protein